MVYSGPGNPAPGAGLRERCLQGILEFAVLIASHPMELRCGLFAAKSDYAAARGSSGNGNGIRDMRLGTVEVRR